MHGINHNSPKGIETLRAIVKLLAFWLGRTRLKPGWRHLRFRLLLRFANLGLH